MIPILKKLRALEDQAGKDVTLGVALAAAEPGQQTGQPKSQSRRRSRQNTQQVAEGESTQDSKQEKRAEGKQKTRLHPTRGRKESRDGREVNEGEINEKIKGKYGGNMKDEVPEERGSEVLSPGNLSLSVTTVYVGGIPAELRVSELKTALREREAAPLRLTWQGAQHRAFLDYSDPQSAEHALEALHGLSLNGQTLQAELAKSQQGGKRSGQSRRRPRPSAALKSKIVSPDTKDDTAEKTDQ